MCECQVDSSYRKQLKKNNLKVQNFFENSSGRRYVLPGRKLEWSTDSSLLKTWPAKKKKKKILLFWFVFTHFLGSSFENGRACPTSMFANAELRFIHAKVQNRVFFQSGAKKQWKIARAPDSLEKQQNFLFGPFWFGRSLHRCIGRSWRTRLKRLK